VYDFFPDAKELGVGLTGFNRFAVSGAGLDSAADFSSACFGS
jgi:hypothetical protein